MELRREAEAAERRASRAEDHSFRDKTSSGLERSDRNQMELRREAGAAERRASRAEDHSFRDKTSSGLERSDRNQ